MSPNLFLSVVAVQLVNFFGLIFTRPFFRGVDLLKNSLLQARPQNCTNPKVAAGIGHFVAGTSNEFQYTKQK